MNEKHNILKREFCARNTQIVARELLGCILCRKSGSEIFRGKIVETEAYVQEDAACHAHKGRTKRSSSLFEQPGTAYVYLIYGMYNCLNVVTDRKDYGSGVLLRALEPLSSGLETNGPGKLCRAFEINSEVNKTDLLNPNSDIWIEYGEKIPDGNVVQTARVGIKHNAHYPWRFYIKDNKWVSKR